MNVPFHGLARLCLVPCVVLAACTGSFASPVKIFFDTDMLTDCDDAGAMAVLHSLADMGECEILATVVSVPNLDSVKTVRAINAWRGRADLPLGMVKHGGVREKSRFVSGIAEEFKVELREEEVPDGVEVYLKILEKQPDRSVVVVTVGYLTHLKALLDRAKAEPATEELIRNKIRLWVCMGGNFIGMPPKDDLKLGNVNFQRDAESALRVIHGWPGEILFAGREVCSVPSGLAIGGELAGTPPGNPVRRAYELYFGGVAKKRHVADLVAVYAAARGGESLWDVSDPGQMLLAEDITFTWESKPDGRHSYLLKRRENGVPDDRVVESKLSELLIRPPTP